MELKSQLQKLFIDGVLISFHVNAWSGARILRPEDLGLEKEDISEAFKLGRKMLIPKAVIQKFHRLDVQGRKIIEKNSIVFPIGSARFIPRRRLAKTVKELTRIQSEYLSAAEELTVNYQKYREEMLPVYQQAAEVAFDKKFPAVQEFGAVENLDNLNSDRETKKGDFVQAFMTRVESYYPKVEKLRSKFDMTWDLFEVDAPRMKLTTSEDISDEETAKALAADELKKQMSNKIASFVNDAVTVLRQETSELCKHIATAIQEGRVVKSSTIQSLREFIDRFKDMNFVGDTIVESQLEELRTQFLEQHENTSITQEIELKEELGRRLNLIADEAEKLTEADIGGITGRYARSLNMD